MKQARFSRHNRPRPYRQQTALNSTFQETQARPEWTQQEQPAEIEFEQLRQQLSDLNEQLGWDRANAVCQENRRIEYEEQLDETREQLYRQKTLKEMFINQGKATRAELERLEKYSDPDTLSTARIATMVTTKIKRRKKKLLQMDYEELQMAYLKSQSKYEESLQEEKNKNKLLEDELTSIRLHQVHLNNEMEVHPAGQQQHDALQLELENEKMQRVILQNKYEELLKLHTESLKQLTAELQAENRHLQEDSEKVKASQHQICSNYEAEIISVRKQAETIQQDLEKEIEQKAVLQKEYERLQKAYALSQKKFVAELQVCTSHNKELQKKLEEMAISKHEIQQKWEADVNAATQHVKAIQAKQDHHCQELEMQINILKKNALEKEERLEDVTAQLNSQILLNVDLSTELEADHPPRKRAWREERNPQPCQQEQSIFNQSAIKRPRGAQISEDGPSGQEQPITMEPTVTPPEQAEAPQATNSASFWKKTRHRLGLRKPERWK